MPRENDTADRLRRHKALVHRFYEELWNRWKIAGRAVNHPPAVRFSTTIFNTEAEVDTVLEALATIAREKPPVAEAAVASA